MRHYFLLLFAAVLLLSAGCSKTPEAPQPEAASVQYATEEPDSLADVLDVIYADISMKGLEDANSEVLTTLFHMEPSWVQGYAIRYSDGRYGVADVAILKPSPEHHEDVIGALELRRNDRITEFENYDVHDALNISKNAEIFSRGNYVIMLMLAEADDARTRILEQIPG